MSWPSYRPNVHIYGNISFSAVSVLFPFFFCSHFVGRFDPDFLDERSRELQGFLGKALVKIQVTNSQYMLNFLEVRAVHFCVCGAEFIYAAAYLVKEGGKLIFGIGKSWFVNYFAVLRTRWLGICRWFGEIHTCHGQRIFEELFSCWFRQVARHVNMDAPDDDPNSDDDDFAAE